MSTVSFTMPAGVLENVCVGWVMWLPVPMPSPRDTEGMLRFEDDVLTVEFQHMLGPSFDSQVRTVELALDDIDSVTLNRGMRGTVLAIRAKRLGTLAQLPHHRRGEARILISQRDREAANELVSRLSVRLAEIDLERMDREISTMAR